MNRIRLKLKNFKTRILKDVVGCTGDVSIWPSVELKPTRGGKFGFSDGLQLKRILSFVQQVGAS